jgi:hypothetical protein
MRNLKKRFSQNYVARLKKDLLSLLARIENLEIRERKNLHQSSFEKDVAALRFLIGEAD